MNTKYFRNLTRLIVAIAGFALAQRAFAYSVYLSTINSGTEEYWACDGEWGWYWNDELDDYEWEYDPMADCYWHVDYYWYVDQVQVQGTVSGNTYVIDVVLSNGEHMGFVLQGNGGTVSQNINYTSNDPSPSTAGAEELGMDYSSMAVRPSGALAFSFTSSPTEYSRTSFEGYLESILGRGLKSYEKGPKGVLNNGCIGLTTLLMQVKISGKVYITPNPETTDSSFGPVHAFLDRAYAEAWLAGNCSDRDFMFVKAGSWKNSVAPTPDSTTHEVPVDSVDTSGSFNYIVYVASEGKWLGMNNGIAPGAPAQKGLTWPGTESPTASGSGGVIYLVRCLPTDS